VKELRRLEFTATEVEQQLFDARTKLGEVHADVKKLQVSAEQ
jgi:hypothetical protein